MGKAYRLVKTLCSICKNRMDCMGYRRIEKGQAIDYGTLMVMANCDRWDPEKKEEGEEK